MTLPDDRRRTLCPILVYHGVGAPNGGREHRVSRAKLNDQLRWLSDHFDVVPVAALCDAADLAGKAAVTFDDALESVFTDGLEVADRVGVPVSVYVIASMLKSRVFWRHCIQWIDRAGLAEDFARFCATHGMIVHPVGGRMYKASKSEGVPSAHVAHLALAYARRAGRNDFMRLRADVAAFERPGFTTGGTASVTFGNHTLNHLVLSQISHQRLDREIGTADGMLKRRFRTLCPALAVPFGGEATVNAQVARVASRFGYRALLLSRQAVQAGAPQHVQMYGGPGAPASIRILDRVMPGPTLDALRAQLATLAVGRPVPAHLQP